MNKAKRVIVIDTSNEIAGDGDIPHPAIGSARRLMVPHPDQQHAVMIEVVENHMPEVIIVDEIGTTQEAMAARTIAERGVQLIGTAHGSTLENLISKSSPFRAFRWRANRYLGGRGSATPRNPKNRERAEAEADLRRGGRDRGTGRGHCPPAHRGGRGCPVARNEPWRDSTHRPRSRKSTTYGI